MWWLRGRRWGSPPAHRPRRPHPDAAPPPWHHPHPPPPVVAGRSVILTDARGCTVHLLAPLASLTLTRLTHCTVVVGGVAASLHASSLDGCVVHVAAAAQVRLHGCVDSDFHLAVRAPPVIEGCTRLRFAAADLDFPGRPAVVAAVTPPPPLPPPPGDEVAAAAMAAAPRNRWAEVQDFDWLRGGPSPNWEALVSPSQLTGPVRVGFDTAGAPGGGADPDGQGGKPPATPTGPDGDAMATDA